jgi:HD-like signal output (HDOD) protein
VAGEALTRKWRLPNALSEVARYHHVPSQAEQFTLEAAIVHIADILISSTDQFGHSGDSHVPPLDPKAWDLLAIDEQVLPDILLQVTEKIDDLTSALTSY